jgi:hypothetical protein
MEDVFFLDRGVSKWIENPAGADLIDGFSS